MPKETREAYAERREVIARRRAIVRASMAGLRTSGALGAQETAWYLRKRQQRLAAEGAYTDAAIIHEVLRLRRALVRANKRIALLSRFNEAVVIATITGQRSTVEYIERPARDVVLQRRLERKQARASRKAGLP